MKKDPHRLAKIEQAIANKYGKEAVANVRADWDQEKEKRYLEQLKEISEKEKKSYLQSEKIEVNGIKLPQRLINKDSRRSCPVCEVYSFKLRDDVYMTKFECCFKCYVQYVEGREERWKRGWRPNNENQEE